MNKYIKADDDVADAHLPEYLAGGNMLASLYQLMRQWRWLIAICIAAALLMGWVVVQKTVPLYRAEALVEVKAEKFLSGANMGKDGELISQKDYLKTQFGVLQSRGLAERVVRQYGFAKANGPLSKTETTEREAIAAEKLLENLNVESVPESWLFRISYISDNPVKARNIANAFVDNAIKASIERDSGGKPEIAKMLKSQSELTQKQIEEEEKKLLQYSKGVGIAGIEDEESEEVAAMTPEALNYASLSTSLSQAVSDRVQAESNYKNGADASNARSESTLFALMEEKGRLEVEFEEKSKLFKPDYPVLQLLSSNIASLDQKIEKMRSNMNSISKSQLRKKYQAALETEKRLRGELEKAKKAVNASNDASAEFEIVKQKLDSLRDTHQILMERSKSAALEIGLEKGDIHVVDRAILPKKPFWPNRLFIMLIALAVGIGAGILLPLLINLMKKRGTEIAAQTG